jgi:hypothetical protein
MRKVIPATEESVESKPKKSFRLRRPRQKFPLVEVWWDDATGLKAGWTQELDEIEFALVLSVGFLIKETEGHIIIAQDIDSDGAHNSRSQIPSGMIKKMKVLRNADKQNEASGV